MGNGLGPWCFSENRRREKEAMWFSSSRRHYVRLHKMGYVRSASSFMCIWECVPHVCGGAMEARESVGSWELELQAIVTHWKEASRHLLEDQ